MSQFLVGRTATSIDLDGKSTEVVLSGNPEAVSSIEKVKELVIAGPGGVVPLGELAQVSIRQAPVSYQPHRRAAVRQHYRGYHGSPTLRLLGER